MKTKRNYIQKQKASKNQQNNKLKIQTYRELVASLPTLGIAVWIIGGFVLYAAVITVTLIQGGSVTGPLLMLLPLLKLFKS